MKRIVFGFILGLCALPLTAGASGLWTGSTSITSPFYTAWQHHQGCGKHTSGVRRGYYGNYHQTFAHCSMTFSTVYVTHLRTPIATPRPTHTPPPPAPLPPATAIPTPAPTATRLATSVPPTDTPATSTPVPTPTTAPAPTPIPLSDPTTYELSLMDTTRAQYGLPPYSINPTESNGTATCPGSYGHSVHMSQTGILAHDQFPADICLPVRAAGENIGYAGGFSVTGALQTIHDQMMAEQHDTAFCAQFSNHACSIISPTYTQVGIGIYVSNGLTWLTVDFLQ